MIAVSYLRGILSVRQKSAQHTTGTLDPPPELLQKHATDISTCDKKFVEMQN
jgi:hypothetical protein